MDFQKKPILVVSGLRLRFILKSDPLLGATIEACLEETSIVLDYNSWFKRIDVRNYRSLEKKPGEQEIELIRLLEEVSYDRLARNLTKLRIPLPDLLKSKPEHFHKTVFRPLVDRRLLLIISFIRENNLPLHFCENERIHKEPLLFESEPSDVTFHFRKNEEGLSYFITVLNRGRELSLMEKPGCVIIEEPCYAMAGGVIYQLPDIDGKRIRPFLARSEIMVPARMEMKYFQTFVFQTTCRYPVKAEGFRVETIDPVIRPVLTLASDWQGEAVAILSFVYPFRELLFDRPETRLVKMSSGIFPPEYEVIVRDFAYEASIADLLGKSGLRLKTGSGFVPVSIRNGLPASAYELVTLITEFREEFLSAGMEIRQDWDRLWFLGESLLESKISESPDWFDIYIEIHVGDWSFPFYVLRDHILSGNREFMLPDGQCFLIPEEWFSRFRDTLLLGRREVNSFRISKYHYPLLETIQGHQQDYRLLTEDFIRKLVDDKREINSPSAGLLRPYQMSGTRWMACLMDEHFGGCLSDDMGLGKTLQTLALLSHIRGTGSYPVRKVSTAMPTGQLSLFDRHNDQNSGHEVCTSLVVMPVSILHNWENEIRKFTPELRFYRMTGPDRRTDAKFLSRYDMVLTTYGIIRNDWESLRDMTFLYLILDESQAIKNPDSESSRAVRRIRSEYRLILTGTPVENTLTDLWSQMDFLNPGLLGSRELFNQHYLTRIGRGEDHEVSESLRKLIRPFILRRTKEAVAPELPELSVEVRYCEPTPEQASIYERKKSEIRNYLLGQAQNLKPGSGNIQILNSLLKLRLLANHPFLHDPAYSGTSGKTDEILEMAKEIIEGGHKILIFSQFVMHLNLIRERFDLESIRSVSLTGSDRPDERKIAIERFNKDPEIPVFLISLKAGGVGLNLTAADYVFILDPWWNPASELQAISRAHRIGQDKKVFAYKFITEGTIEEKILNLQSRKQDLADLMINENALDFSDPEMLRDLLD